MIIPAASSLALVTSYISALSARQWDALPGYFAPNATWWTSGNPERVAHAGLTTATTHLPLLPSIADKFESYKFDIVNIVGRPGDVVLEGRVTGTGPGELVYVNNITMAFEMDAGDKIVALREYPVHSEIEWLLKYFEDHGLL